MSGIAAAVLEPRDLALFSAGRLPLTGHDFGGVGPIDVIGPSARPSGAARANHAPTLAGIDVLEAEGLGRLRGKRIAVLTHQAGRARSGARTIDVLARAKGVKLVALFSPEHGLVGQLDAKVPDSRDESTGLPVFSLYGDTRRPTDEMLQGIDLLVVDLQDIGSRFYTYPATLAYSM